MPRCWLGGLWLGSIDEDVLLDEVSGYDGQHHHLALLLPQPGVADGHVFHVNPVQRLSARHVWPVVCCMLDTT